MLRKHLVSIAKIERTPSLKYRVQRYFNLPRGSLLRTLRGYSQADLVLCLMRINTPLSRTIAESLIGKPIVVGPACRFVYEFNKRRPTLRRQPVVTFVCSDPELRSRSRLALLWHHFKVGRTRDQLLQRGVRNGDIKRAVARGMVRIAQ